MLNIKKILRIIIFVIISVLNLYITIASSTCPYTVEGKDANILENCFIETSEASPLKIIFNECEDITIRYYEFAENDNGPIYDRYPGSLIPGSSIEKNIIVYNDNSKGLSNFLPITYIPWVTCDNQRDKYKPHIKVYPHDFGKKFPEPQPDKNRPPKWISNIEVFVINGYTKINLLDYFIDEDNDTLTFSSNDLSDIQVLIENEFVHILPDNGFSGNKTIIFTASDGKSKPIDKKIKLIISKKPEPQRNSNGWVKLKAFILKYWKYFGISILLILGIIYAKIKWGTPITDSIKGVIKKVVKKFEKTIKNFGIPKKKK